MNEVAKTIAHALRERHRRLHAGGMETPDRPCSLLKTASAFTRGDLTFLPTALARELAEYVLNAPVYGGYEEELLARLRAEGLLDRGPEPTGGERGE